MTFLILLYKERRRCWLSWLRFLLGRFQNTIQLEFLKFIQYVLLPLELEVQLPMGHTANIIVLYLSIVVLGGFLVYNVEYCTGDRAFLRIASGRAFVRHVGYFL